MSNIAVLLKECLEHLKQENIKVDLVLSETIDTPEELPCIGYFDDKERSLKVAIREANWLFTFVHEYCHFVQNLNSKWTDDFSVNASNKFEQWLKHEIELSNLEVLNLTRNIQDCELDCERRTIDLLKFYNIEFNELEYIKLANRYVFSYEIARLYRNDIKFSDSPLVDKLIPDSLIDDVAYLPAGLLSFIEFKGL